MKQNQISAFSALLVATGLLVGCVVKGTGSQRQKSLMPSDADSSGDSSGDASAATDDATAACMRLAAKKAAGFKLDDTTATTTDTTGTGSTDASTTSTDATDAATCAGTTDGTDTASTGSTTDGTTTSSFTSKH